MGMQPDPCRVRRTGSGGSRSNRAERPHPNLVGSNFGDGPANEADNSALPRGIASGSRQPAKAERPMSTSGEERVASAHPHLSKPRILHGCGAFLLLKQPLNDPKKQSYG